MKNSKKLKYIVSANCGWFVVVATIFISLLFVLISSDDGTYCPLRNIEEGQPCTELQQIKNKCDIATERTSFSAGLFSDFVFVCENNTLFIKERFSISQTEFKCDGKYCV